MIQEFEDHVKKLRQFYVDASMSQRIEIARQRTTYPDCGPNILCNTIGALEALARAVLLEIKIRKGQPRNLSTHEATFLREGYLYNLFSRNHLSDIPRFPIR